MNCSIEKKDSDSRSRQRGTLTGRMMMVLGIGIFFLASLFFTSEALAADRYWVGPADGVVTASTAYWSTTSGGTGGASVPGSSDRAIFDGGGVNNATISANWSLYTLYIQATYSGVISHTAGTLTINKDFTNLKGATVFTSAGTVSIVSVEGSLGSGVITTGGVTFNNLTLTNTASNYDNTITLANNFTVAGNLSYTGNRTGVGISFVSGSGSPTITLQGNYSQSGNGIPNFGNGITLNMTGADKTFSMTAGQLRGTTNLNGTGATSLIMSSAANPSSSQYGTGGTVVINPTSGVVVLTGTSYFYNLNINANKTLDTSPNGGTNVYNIQIYNNMTNQAGAIFTARTGTVTFDNSTTDSTITPGGITFNNLSLYSNDPANTIYTTTITGTFTIAGNLSISHGGSSGNNGHAWKSTAGATITLQGNYSQSSNRADSIPFFGEGITLNMTGADKSFTMTHGQLRGTTNLNGTGTTSLRMGSVANPNAWQYGAGGTIVVNPTSGVVVLSGTSYFYHLVINNGKTLDASPDGGSTVYNMTIYYNMTNQAGAIFTARTGTVTFDTSLRSPTITTGGITFNNLTITAGSGLNTNYTTTIADSFTVAGNLSVSTYSGTNSIQTVSAGSAKTITLGGNYSESHSGASLVFGANISINMTGADKTFTVNSGAFNANLTFGGTGTTTVSKAGTATGGTTTVNPSSGVVILSAASTFYALTVTKTLDLNGYNLTAGGTFTLGAASTLRLKGTETVSTATVTAGNLVEYYGAVNSALKAWTYSQLLVNSTSASTVFSLAGNTTVSTTTISSGIVSLAGYNFTVTNMINDGTMRLRGSESLIITNQDTDSGTTEYVGDGDGAADTYLIKNLNYYNLNISSVDTADIYDGLILTTVLGNLNLTNGTLKLSSSGNINISGNFNMSGGTLNEYSYLVFGLSAAWQVPSDVSSVNVLVVGGGGGGAWGAGGGGGGVLASTSYPVIPGETINVVVATTSNAATKGSNSIFKTLTAYGGGGGGATPGAIGGSGGGAGVGWGTNYAGGTATPSGQGYIVGPIYNSGPFWKGGAGGGGGAVGTAQSGTYVGPVGGIGFLSSITGVATRYAGGGGGSGVYSSQSVTITGGAGGDGGGGAGGNSPIGGVNTNGTDGTPNTGGGGGGSGYPSAGVVSGKGASGIVIVAYNSSSTQPTHSISLSGNLIHASGTISTPKLGINLIGTNQTLTFNATTTIASLSKTLGVGSTTNQILSFGTTSPLIITGTTTLSGADGDGLTLKLRSAEEGVQWKFDPQATSSRVFGYLDVQDSNNINATPIDTELVDGYIDSGNNTGWGSAAAIVSVIKSGTQIATTTTPLDDVNLGGAFLFSTADGDADVTSIKLKQIGSLATTSIDNIRLTFKDAVDGACSATEPAGTSSFGTAGAFDDNGIATTTGTLSLTEGTPVCLYVKYDLTEEYSTSTLGKSIDFEITNPSTDIVVDGGTVGTTGKVNITGRTVISTTDIVSFLSLNMAGDQNPTVFFLQNDAVWKKVGRDGVPVRLTNPNLKVHTLTFTELTGANSGGTVKMDITVSNVSQSDDPNFMTVTRTYGTTASVKAWSGND